MATPVDLRPVRPPGGADLGAAIARYLEDAETGRARAADGAPYTPPGLRSLRRSLEHVHAALPAMSVPELRALNAEELESLGRQIAGDDGHTPVIVDALRRLWASARAETAPDPPPPGNLPAPAPVPTPTQAVLLLGAQASAWIERAMVIALVLTAIGLAVALV
jgi:hypothetical protein